MENNNIKSKTSVLTVIAIVCIIIGVILSQNKAIQGIASLICFQCIGIG